MHTELFLKSGRLNWRKQTIWVFGYGLIHHLHNVLKTNSHFQFYFLLPSRDILLLGFFNLVDVAILIVKATRIDNQQGLSPILLGQLVQVQVAHILRH